MASETRDRVELLPGTLDLIVLRALDTMGPQHAYGSPRVSSRSRSRRSP